EPAHPGHRRCALFVTTGRIRGNVATAYGQSPVAAGTPDIPARQYMMFAVVTFSAGAYAIVCGLRVYTAYAVLDAYHRSVAERATPDPPAATAHGGSPAPARRAGLTARTH